MLELRQFDGLQLKRRHLNAPQPFVPFFAAALLPWSMLSQEVSMTQALEPLRDGAQIELAVGKDCENPFKRFLATVARAPKARAKGLSHRAKPLSPDEAMLFVFDSPEPVTFWMKETLIPLDLAFFTPTGDLSDVRHMAVEADPSNPKTTYSSPRKVLFALETHYHALKPLKGVPSVLCFDRCNLLRNTSRSNSLCVR